MSKMSEREIAQLLGQEPPPEEKPTTRTGLAKAAHNELDDRVERYVESQRQPGETSERAYARVMDENRGLYAKLQAARDAATRAHGVGVEYDAAPLGSQRAW